MSHYFPVWQKKVQIFLIYSILSVLILCFSLISNYVLMIDKTPRPWSWRQFLLLIDRLFFSFKLEVSFHLKDISQDAVSVDKTSDDMILCGCEDQVRSFKVPKHLKGIGQLQSHFIKKLNPTVLRHCWPILAGLVEHVAKYSSRLIMLVQHRR